MTLTDQVSSRELGSALAALRDSAGIKQAELASRLKMSPAVLSRIESGEREASEEEVSRIVQEIGTPQAALLPRALARSWTVLDRPPLSHPDQELLWEAEQVAASLRDFLAEDRPLRDSFRKRISTYIEELRLSAVKVSTRDYQIVLIGKIGIGKSTVLCRITNLEISKPNMALPDPVFATGSGRVTVCEIHLKRGASYGISIEPLAFEEVRAYVYDFAEQILRSDLNEFSERETQEEGPGISAEINRAIRNMSGLTTKKARAHDGKLLKIDRAKALAEERPDIRDFVLEVLSRMNLPARDRREIFYQDGSSKSPLLWLQEIFAQINAGRHPEFTIPQRIEVSVPANLLPCDDVSVKFVDTRGVAESVARPDLERFFDISHTVLALCSGFNDAPSDAATTLLKRARAAGNRSLGLTTFVMVLARPGEALEVRDDSGDRAETILEGYELKELQAQESLANLGFPEVLARAFDARTDAVERAHDLLAGRVNVLRENYRYAVQKTIKDANASIENFDTLQVQFALKEAAAEISLALDRIVNFDRLKGHIEDSIIEQFDHRIHHATVKATARRSGEWYNFHYGHHLGSGARQLAVKTLSGGWQEFCNATDSMLGMKTFKDAEPLLSQTKQVLTVAYDLILRKAELLGENFFEEKIKRDAEFWREVEQPWGGGYREHVRDLNLEWFSEESHRKVEKELSVLLQAEWGRAIDDVRSLLPIED